jgi:thiol-disulfide isomerase/thioredoxin
MSFCFRVSTIAALLAGLGLLASGCAEKVDPEALRRQIEAHRAELDALAIEPEKADLLFSDDLEGLAGKKDSAAAALESGNLPDAAARYEELLTASKDFARRVEESAWVSELEEDRADWAEAVCAAHDGGYVVAGVVTHEDRGDKDVYLAKLTPTGEEVWRRVFGGPEKELAPQVRPTPDGGYLLSAQTSSFKDYNGDIFVVKTDGNGEEEWSKTYGGSGTDAPVDALPLGDGGRILIVGRAFNGADGMDVYTALTDSAGEILHEARVGGTGDQYINSVAAGTVSPEGLLLAGVDGDLNLNATKPLLIRIEIVEDAVRVAEKIAVDLGGYVNPNSIFAVAGEGETIMTAGLITEDKQIRAWSGHDASEDIVVAAVGGSGAIRWRSQFGGNAWDSPRGLAALKGGGHAVLAQTRSYGAGEEDLYLFAVDASGEEVWARTIGTDAFEVGHAFYAAPAGGFLIAGGRKAERRDSTLNTLLVKTNSTGHSWNDGAIYASAKLVPIVVAVAATPQGATGSLSETAVKVGEQAPEIEAAEWIHADDTISLAGLRGQVVVVEFWATWCGPCRQSTPHLVELSHKYKDRGVTFLGMTDEPRAEAPVDAFIKEFSVDYIIGAGSQSILTYGVMGVPTAFVIDGEGVVQWVGHPMNALEEAIEAALDSESAEPGTS